MKPASCRGRTVTRLAPAGVVVAAVAAAGCAGTPEPGARETLENATFLTLDGDEITLAAGTTTGPDGVRYELLLTEDGDLDFDSNIDAVAVLAADHGQERFLTVHALLREGDRLQDVSARLVGDRIEVHRAEVLNGMIRLNIRIRRPGEPIITRPSVDRKAYFALTNRGLRHVTPIDDDAGGEAQADGADAGSGTPAALYAREWELESFDRGDWSADLSTFRTPVKLRFRAEPRDAADANGEMAGFAGCNRVFGSFRMYEAEALRFHGVAAMRKVCGDQEADFERRFLEALRSVQAIRLEGDRMTLALRGGAIRFRAGRPLVASAPGTAPDPPAGSSG